MIEEPDVPRRSRLRRGVDAPRLSPAPPAPPEPAVPPAAPPPLDEWDLGEPEVGWAAVAPPPPGLPAGVPAGLPAGVPEDGSGASDTDPAAGPGVREEPPERARRDHDARPLLLRVLRPWFEPRPGELRGAIVVLALALAVSLALWFDASRRPGLETVDGGGIGAGVAAVPGDGGALAGTAAGSPAGAAVPVGQVPVPGRADGSDGWGLGPGGAGGPVVHVSGAVREPGVVTLGAGARVADAVDAAGGAMPDARLALLNLARPVDDGERIHVPRVGEDAPPPPEAPSRGVLPDGRIDLNAASAEELQTLPGVGPARAEAILAERAARPFRVPGDLRRVPGIGEATFQRLAPLVAVR